MTVFLVVIWFTVCEGPQNSRKYKREIFDNDLVLWVTHIYDYSTKSALEVSLTIEVL